MSPHLFGLAAAGVFVLLIVLGVCRFAKGPEGFVRRSPDRKEVAVVVVALLFAAALMGFAYSPYASTVSIIGLAILGNAIVLAMSARRRREADRKSPDDAQ